MQGKTWQHDKHMISKTLHAKTVHDDNQGAGPGPPHPSARLPRNTSPGFPRWPVHYPDLHHYSNGSIVFGTMTIKATKFMGPHKSRVLVHNQCLLINKAHTTRSLIDTGEGYHIAPRISSYPFSTFPSGDTPLVVP
jgi:hypothetical protein